MLNSILRKRSLLRETGCNEPKEIRSMDKNKGSIKGGIRMRICFITERYPTEEYPVNTFLDKLVCEMADQGVECTVIAPYRPIVDKIKKKKYKTSFYRERVTARGKIIKIYNPTYFCGTNKKFAGINMEQIRLHLFTGCVDKVIKKQRLEFDAVYGHFILPSGFAAAEIGRRYEKSAFFAYGESSFVNVGRSFSDEEIRNKLSNISGVIAVSSKNRDELVEHKVIDSEKIGVFLNAIDTNVFCVSDKNTARKNIGINNEDFVVAFVGSFINRKGSKRLSAALDRVDNAKSIFIGAGSDEPTCKNIIHKGRLPHDQIAQYLNAADIFVLPTLAEGCCNAIVEALACGLPIVSSNLPFNDDILTDENSIRIDPNDVEAIAEAIKKLKDNPALREKMAEAALESAKRLTIQKRAENILKFMNEAIE